ncbi:hypothetical protein Barb7_00537 [Bacteroidales bacterium Barb7]|nr:hypothetical protein Barb7_00537 [Bacteroidales bacterium Barb7]
MPVRACCLQSIYNRRFEQSNHPFGRNGVFTTCALSGLLRTEMYISVPGEA